MTHDPHTRIRSARARTARALNDIERNALREDPANPVTTSTDPGGAGDGRPTEAQALARDAWHLDRYAATAERIADQAERAAAELTPTTRRPSKPCACCHEPDRLATHPRRVTFHRGHSEETRRIPLCWWCSSYHRRHGYLCDDQIHAGRPAVKLCDCGPDCCPSGCPDRVAPDRTSLSDRCAKRLSRARA